jgi:hypothetical protein
MVTVTEICEENRAGLIWKENDPDYGIIPTVRA